MDGPKEEGQKLTAQAARPTGIDAGEGAAAPSSAEVADPRTPLSDDSADKTFDDAPAAAGDEVDDDQQVESFYTLLANIRAMRRMYTPGGGETAAGGSGTRKRLRAAAEPPWRPAFRLEDFEDDASGMSKCAKKKERSQADDGEEKGPVVTLPSMSEPPSAGTSPSARRAGRNSNSI